MCSVPRAWRLAQPPSAPGLTPRTGSNRTRSASPRIAVHRSASQRIASHRVASQWTAHRSASHIRAHFEAVSSAGLLQPARSQAVARGEGGSLQPWRRRRQPPLPDGQPPRQGAAAIGQSLLQGAAGRALAWLRVKVPSGRFCWTELLQLRPLSRVVCVRTCGGRARRQAKRGASELSGAARCRSDEASCLESASERRGAQRALGSGPIPKR